jgi:tetratricopeptide (TPR) repeat protein
MKHTLLKATAIIILLLFIQIDGRAQQLNEAIRLSHVARYADAEKVFSDLLAKDEGNTSILIAAGFNSAWNKDYKSAKERFTKAQKLEPANIDASKGLAYTYLYKGDFQNALKAFNSLSSGNPSSVEYQMSAGLAYMNMLKKKKAAEVFKQVLKLDPRNAEAANFIEQIRKEKGKIELSFLAGASGVDGNNKAGLRQVQLGYRINSENILYARYDNSLSLDNYFLLRNNFNANALVAGFYSRWHYRIGSKVEYSYRNLPGNVKQNLVQTEQVLFLPKNFQVKAGGSIITSNQSSREWNLMSGLSIPAGKKFKVEPFYYFIHRQADEHRVVMNISYKVKENADIAAGFFRGKEKSAKLNIDNTVSGMYAYSNFIISGPLSGTLLFRDEKDAEGRKAFTAAFGVKLLINTKR